KSLRRGTVEHDAFALFYRSAKRHHHRVRRKELEMFRNLGVAVFLLVTGIRAGPCIAQEERALALVGGTVYASPTAAPLSDAVVVVSRGAITAMGNRSDVQIPQSARVINCTGKSLTAGFWNSHVHFTEPAWRDAASAPADGLTKHMQEMLTKWGFTTVWDLGSNASDTQALRRR